MYDGQATPAMPGSRWTVAALSGLALWTWLIGFFFFGPLLGGVYGAGADAVGYAFATGHAAGLAFFGADARRCRLPPAMLYALVPLTLLGLVGPPIALAAPVAACAGFLGAAAVLRWVRAVQRSMSPGLALALAAGGANVLFWLFGLPMAGPTLMRWVGGCLVLVAIALAAATLPRDGESGPPRAASSHGHRWLPPPYLLGFALAVYVAGGVLYGVLIKISPAHSPAEWIGTWPYIIVFILAAAGTQTANLGRLQALTLGVLSVGAVLLAAYDLLSWDFTLAWTAVMGGLGLADAFYWRRAIELLGKRGTMPAGVALAWNVVVVAGTDLLSQRIPFPPLEQLPAAGLLIALALFLLGPLLADAAVRSRRDDPPPALTRSEVQVLNLLLSGQTDLEIAEVLYISRNTVKFHVRNVLHKMGYPNRRELRRSYVAPPTE